MISRADGYTLIEALVTVSIIGVVSVLSAPSISDFLQRQSVRADNQFGLKAFTLARTQAMVIDEAATTVCWNSSDVNIDMTDGVDTTYTLSPGEVIVAEGPATNFDEILTSGQMMGDNNAIFDSDADDCIGFDSQGRLTGTGGNLLGIVFCRDDGDNKDAMRLEVILGGRVSIKKNANATGWGVQNCT